MTSGRAAVVLVNDRCLLRPRTGIGVYVENLLSHWPCEGSCKAVGFLSSWLPRRFLSAGASSGKERVRLVPLSAVAFGGDTAGSSKRRLKSTVLEVYHRLFALRFQAGRYRAYFEPNYLPVRVDGPIVTTCCDLSVLEHPEWQPPDRVARWEAAMDAALELTCHWIAISAFTRDRMISLLGLPPERISVVPLAPRPLPYPQKTGIEEKRRAAGLPKRFLLHVGTLEPRKNIPCLLDAYALLPPAVRCSVKLILAGGKGWGSHAFWRSLRKHPIAGEVLTSGRVSDSQLALLFACAEAVVVPSWYEGFGLPVLEAMRCGTPVLCSSAEALVEVAGTAAAVIDPADHRAWADAMRGVLEDRVFREDLRRKGIERAARFSWNVCAQLHAEVIGRVAA